MQTGDYEIAAFFALVAIFEVCERLWPARQVVRWRDLGLDVLSFAFALTVNRVCTFLLRAWVGDTSPHFLAGAVAFLQGFSSPVKILLAVFVVDFFVYSVPDSFPLGLGETLSPGKLPRMFLGVCRTQSRLESRL